MSASADRQQRTLRSYLLLPRPKDAVKWWILPVTFAVGALARGGVSGHQLARAAVVWAVLELLVYQARYQWNDIRGFRADQAHPDAAGRGRLPGPLDRARPHITASAAAALLRLAAVPLVALALPGLRLAGFLAVLTLAVLGVAAVYELLRSRATGRSGQVPVPLRPALLGLWVAVGGGYAARGLAGLALAVDIWSDPGLAVAAGLTMWGYGVTFVTARWAIEALPFAHLDGTKVVWRADSRQAREHLLGLARWMPGDAAPGDLSRWQPLAGRTPATAPWNLAVVVAAMAATLTGELLTGAGAAVTVVATGGLFALAVTRSRSSLRPIAVALGAVVLIGLSAAAGSDSPVVAVLPWVVIAGSYTLACAQTLRGMGEPALSRAWLRPIRS